MPDSMRPASNAQAPDPSQSYERSHPSREAGLGTLGNEGKNTQQPDAMDAAVKNKQDGSRQINAHEVVDEGASRSPAGEANPGQRAAPAQPDHSMKDEEPMGWDQAPTDIQNPRDQRQPKTDGKGGTP